jgi:hypothetical protein
VGCSSSPRRAGLSRIPQNWSRYLQSIDLRINTFTGSIPEAVCEWKRDDPDLILDVMIDCSEVVCTCCLSSYKKPCP